MFKSMRSLPRLASITMFFLMVVSTPASADLVQLWQGMSVAQVLKLKGPALEKSEFESKREELWIYPEEILGFREGVLVTWLNNHHDMFARISEAQEVARRTVESAPVTVKSEVHKSKRKPERVQSLIQEILNDVPSEDSSGPAIPAGPSSIMK